MATTLGTEGTAQRGASKVLRSQSWQGLCRAGTQASGESGCPATVGASEAWRTPLRVGLGKGPGQLITVPLREHKEAGSGEQLQLSKGDTNEGQVLTSLLLPASLPLASFSS